MVTTAEGVESSEQLSRLKLEGCVQVQGYLFSKAMRAADVVGRVETTADQLAILKDIGGQSADPKIIETPAEIRRKKAG
jgi:predicted signal transduction protein with EAL and GGDEF domain